ncbi:MAG: N-acyl-D-amino-acid deacylase family protein, partial [Aquabacterium sp.]
MSEADLLIRHALVVDGTGAPPREADVAVVGDRIAAVGPGLSVRAAETLDGRGLALTPGFVDVHTHFDGQATWDARLWPCSVHGVTTAVMGNCGVGFAPCRPADRERLIELMEGVEDIPSAALTEGLRWDWESFDGYLGALEGRARDIDIAALLPHGPLRVHAMGERAARREAATDADLAQMQATARAALAAGAMGFSTSRTIAHRSARGEHVPMYQAADRELVAIGSALAGQRDAVFQLISDFDDLDAEFDLIESVCRAGGCAGTLTVAQVHQRPGQHERLLERIARANAGGLRITGQVIGRPIGVMLGFDVTINPFRHRPAFKAIEHLPRDEKLARLADPALRATILSQADESPPFFIRNFGQRWDRQYPLLGEPRYLPGADESVAAHAARAGQAPDAWVYDFLLGDDGRALLYVPLANFADGNGDAIEAMLRHPHTVPALGDGGAHVSTICDGSATTFLLTEWVRSRRAFSLEAAVQMLTQRPAQLYGLHDRGRIAPGLRADLNLIDLDALAIEPPRIVR